MPVWQYAQLTIAACSCSRSQDNKCSRAPWEVVPVPERQPADLGKVSMPGLKDRLADAGYGLGWSVVCRLPESWTQSAFRLVADRTERRQGTGVQVLEGNLRRVIGAEASGLCPQGRVMGG
jgi:hypothetical protein